ncbi:MAG: hypothetical protein LBR37_01350 [Erysipelotrichaceae bacterium]|jgi:hypothetical protein|nr:hypothetical protein [Erysipelotrichaceae bacterium]
MAQNMIAELRLQGQNLVIDSILMIHFTRFNESSRILAATINDYPVTAVTHDGYRNVRQLTNGFTQSSSLTQKRIIYDVVDDINIIFVYPFYIYEDIAGELVLILLTLLLTC